MKTYEIERIIQNKLCQSELVQELIEYYEKRIRKLTSEWESEVEEPKNMTHDKNQYFIIRADRAGVFFAQISERRGSEIDLVNCRRIHGWSNACSLSQVAKDGCGEKGGNNRHSVVVESMTVLGVIEIIPCTPAATKNLLEQPVWRH